LDKLVEALNERPARPEEVDRALISAAREQLELLAALPVVPVHGDFWAGNLLKHHRRIHVIDWGHFHYGTPTEDLHNFVAALAYRRRPTPDEEAAIMWDAFFGPSALCSLAENATTRTLERWHIPREMLRPMFVVFVMSRLALTGFSNHEAWRAFAARYVASGMPSPFGR
jgi:aminoglycoside phosphotransferase (APT) family kinase protein